MCVGYSSLVYLSFQLSCWPVRISLQYHDQQRNSPSHACAESISPPVTPPAFFTIPLKNPLLSISFDAHVFPASTSPDLEL